MILFFVELNFALVFINHENQNKKIDRYQKTTTTTKMDNQKKNFQNSNR